LFGTFIDERDDEPIVYGTRSPLRSWNPLWANLEVYKAIWLDAWRARRLRDKLGVWIARPGWHPADVAAKWPAAPFDIRRPQYDPSLSRGIQIYCTVQFSILLLITTHFLEAYGTMSSAQLAIYTLWLASGLWILGGLMERRKAFVAAETFRLLATAAGIALSGAWFGIAALPSFAAIAVSMLAAGSLLALWFVFRHSDDAYGYLSRHEHPGHSTE
jgi:hypothetical protein